MCEDLQGSMLNAWLYFIASDQPQDTRKILEAYPEFDELYREVFAFRFQPEELVSMYSDALRILDANTTQYMIEIYQDENRKLKEDQEEKRRHLEEAQNQLEERDRLISEQEEEILRLKELLTKKQE